MHSHFLSFIFSSGRIMKYSNRFFKENIFQAKIIKEKEINIHLSKSQKKKLDELLFDSICQKIEEKFITTTKNESTKKRKNSISC